MDSWILAFGLFALAMSATPGPNNVMVTASGANFGFRRTIPHMVGVAAGFPVLLFAVGYGVDQVFVLYPASRTALQVAGALYLVYLAWRIASADPTGDAARRPTKPMSLLQAAAFQWLNPKAWLIAVSALGTYAPEGGALPVTLLVMSLLFAAACLPSVALWTLIGMGVGRLLTEPRALRWFNGSMAALLVASLALTFI